jgi:hypothetical protein
LLAARLVQGGKGDLVTAAARSRRDWEVRESLMAETMLYRLLRGERTVKTSVVREGAGGGPRCTLKSK